VLAIGNTTGANDIIVSAGQKIRTPAVAAQDGSSAITIANTTGALTLATGLADSNLATISTAGKVSNSATTATSANTASAIVARDASGNFTAGTVTAALSGNASTATTLQTARTINGVSFNGSADITVTAAAGTLTGSTLASGVTASSLTSVGTLSNLTVTNPISGSVTGSSGSTTGNAATATALQTARSINGVSFNGTADITVTAAAGTLSGSTLASGVTASSLTSVGTLTSLTVSGNATMGRTASFSHTTNPYVRLAKTNATAVNWDIQANSDNSFDISDGTPRLVIDASGRVGIGTTSPASLIHGKGPASSDVTYRFEPVSNSYKSTLYISSVSSGDGGFRYDSNANQMSQFSYGDMIFYVGTANISGAIGNERLRITQGGDVGIGTTSGWASGRLVSQTSSTSAPAAEFNTTGSTSGLAPVYIWNNAESGDPYFIQFYDRGNTLARRNLGYIRYKTLSATLDLVTASDYRIKRVIGPYEKSGAILDKIAIHEGHIYDSPMATPFVLAHELAEAVPYAVDGEKDAVNEDGSPKVQMVAYASLIPLMLAEIKSLRARVAALES
jgi:hypothetical protein